MPRAPQAAVTLPRQVLPGATYMTTRRTAQRQFLLRPSRTTNEIVRFCLGRAMELYPVSMHVFSVLSNHYHMEFTDDLGHMPEFMRYFNQTVARHLNASLGRWENFWAPGSYSAVRLINPQDMVDKAAYILANPVTAGLVERCRDWPGVYSDLEDGETERVAGRPVGFFRPDGPVPEETVVRLSTPPGFASWGDFVAAVRPELARREEEARQAVRQEGRTSLGVAGVKRQRPSDRPTTIEPRRRLNPRIACRDTAMRIAELKRLKAFWQAYRLAWLHRQLKIGNADKALIDRADGQVLFPLGTYQLRRQHGVEIEPPLMGLKLGDERPTVAPS